MRYSYLNNPDKTRKIADLNKKYKRIHTTGNFRWVTTTPDGKYKTNIELVYYPGYKGLDTFEVSFLENPYAGPLAP